MVCNNSLFIFLKKELISLYKWCYLFSACMDLTKTVLFALKKMCLSKFICKDSNIILFVYCLLRQMCIKVEKIHQCNFRLLQKPFQAKTPVSAFFTNMVTGKLSKDACVSDISLSNAYTILKLVLYYISYHSRANLKSSDRYMSNS